MAENKITATHIRSHSPDKEHISGLHSPQLLAKWPAIGLFMFLFGSLSFGGLTYNLLAKGPLLKWDQFLAVTLPAIGLSSPPYVKPIVDSGYYLGMYVLIALAYLLGIYFFYKKSWQELVMLAIGQIGGSALYLASSNYFDRVRPPTQIWIVEKTPSFPSGHALSAVVFFGFLAYIIAPKASTIFLKVAIAAAGLLIILFIGFTRVFTAGHYLTDVLAGYSIGIAWSGAFYTLAEIYFQKRRTGNTSRTRKKTPK